MNSQAKFLFVLITFALNISLFGQEITINGTVSDYSNNGIPGVNVIVKGTVNGTVTNNIGIYQLLVKKGDTIEFSSIGYNKETVVVTGQSEINVKLIESLEGLDQIIVVGYGVQKKSDVTGSLVSLSAKTIANVQSKSIADILQGRAAGVSVVSNGGSPGKPAEINIRGISSINGAPPLWIVDGVPTSGDVNPFDIESMEILKDASATAIYGTKGAGGVILVTTKSGKAGKVKISFNSRFNVSQLPKKLNMLSANDWARLRSEAYQNAGLPVPSSLTNQTFGAGTDWQDAVTRQAFSSDHFASFSGGSKSMNYYLSVNDNIQKGIVKKSDDHTTAIRINTSSRIADWLRIGENLSLSRNVNHAINEDDEWNAIMIQAIAIDPITPIRHADGTWAGSSFNTIDNPVAHLERSKDESRTMSGGGNVFAEINLGDFLFTSRIGYEYSAANDYGYTPTFFVKTGEENVTSAVSRDFYEHIDWVVSNFATYTHTFANTHNVKVMFGNDIEQETNEWFGTSASNLISENSDMIYIDNATGKNAALSNGLANQIRYLSYFGRVNYDYKGKYLLTANIRRQGSSKFGQDKRFGLFPSVSLGWKVSDESFFDNVDFISICKLRVGYGKTGNDMAIEPYSFYSTSMSGQRYVFDNVIVDGVSFPRIGNSELHWEEKKATNVGVDLAMFENRLTFSGDFYIDKTDDMLYNPDLPGHVGAQDAPFTNVASLQNVGYEMQVGYKNQIGDIKYDVNLNFSHVENEILDLGTAQYIADAQFMQFGYISRTEVGHPMAMFYGYKTDGLFQNQAEVDAYVDKNGNLIQPNAKPGDIRYVDADRDGKLDMDFIGNPFPKFTAGLNLHMAYKGFDFTAFFYTSYGNDIFNATKFFTENPSMRYNVDETMKDRWMMEGDTDDPNHCRLNISDANDSFRSDKYVEDGSYLRLKNLQIGYTLPHKLLYGIDLSAFKVFVGAENLYTLTKYSGYDPEIGTGYYGPLDRGIDRVNYPNPRTYYFGVNVNF